jgi:hypothetical protein
MMMRCRALLQQPMMTRVERTLSHSPERLYHILIDFLQHHQRIAPHSVSLGSIEVIEGGVGHGTVVAFGSSLSSTRHPTRYRVVVTEPGVAFELQSEDGTQRLVHHVVGDGAGSSIVTFTWHSTPPSNVIHRIRSSIAHSRAVAVLEEKMDNLDRYAATLGRLVLHADS